MGKTGISSRGLGLAAAEGLVGGTCIPILWAFGADTKGNGRRADERKVLHNRATGVARFLVGPDFARASRGGPDGQKLYLSQAFRRIVWGTTLKTAAGKKPLPCRHGSSLSLQFPMVGFRRKSRRSLFCTWNCAKPRPPSGLAVVRTITGKNLFTARDKTNSDRRQRLVAFYVGRRRRQRLANRANAVHRKSLLLRGALEAEKKKLWQTRNFRENRRRIIVRPSPKSRWLRSALSQYPGNRFCQIIQGATSSCEISAAPPYPAGHPLLLAKQTCPKGKSAGAWHLVDQQQFIWKHGWLPSHFTDRRGYVHPGLGRRLEAGPRKGGHLQSYRSREGRG